MNFNNLRGTPGALLMLYVGALIALGVIVVTFRGSVQI